MTDDVSAALSWFANYTNFYTVLSVLLCFVAMVVFILRLNGENFMLSSATHYVTVREQSMQQINNPFSVQLDKNKSSSLKDGLHLELSMEETSKVQILWGVNIQTFQTELKTPASEISQQLDSNTLFDAKFKHSSLQFISPGDVNRTIHVECPGEVTEDSLGEPPRVTYPVVVVTCLDNLDVPSDDTKIVVQFTVIHLKDSLCNLDSHIVYQFVKTNYNKIISLQPIFMSTIESNNSKKVPNNSTKIQDSDHQNHNNHQSSANPTGQGHCLNDSGDSFIHCDCCGKLQHSFTNIPKTRQHEVCTCAENKVHDSGGNVDHYNSDDNTVGKTTEVSQDAGDNKSHVDENIGDVSQIVNGMNGLHVPDNDRTDETNSERDDTELCCVCQSLAVVFALLPCRHACVCHKCISLLDKCPICRSFIESYFRISDWIEMEEFIPDESENVGPRLNTWEALNQRFNEMLGFT